MTVGIIYTVVNTEVLWQRHRRTITILFRDIHLLYMWGKDPQGDLMKPVMTYRLRPANASLQLVYLKQCLTKLSLSD